MFYHDDESCFFASVPAEELWKGVVGVSNAGKKKGRGKRVGRKKVTDLNRGQVLGTGEQTICRSSNLLTASLQQ